MTNVVSVYPLMLFKFSYLYMDLEYSWGYAPIINSPDSLFL